MKKLTPEVTARAVNKLALMAFFPGDPDTRSALIHVLMELADTEDQLDWLVTPALKLYARWPGPGELRALYCSRFKPKDGAETYSEIYASGFPHEAPAQVFVPPPRGAPVSKDAEMNTAVRHTAQVKSLPTGKGKGRALPK